MKVVILDDEQNAISYLLHQLKSYENMNVEKTFTNACEGLDYLLNNPCDILFCDIDMPEISGIYVAEQLSSLYSNLKICFVTAYDAFAIKAFELSAIDYILKPYTKERLEQCINKITNNSTTDIKALNKLSETVSYNLDIICAYDDDNILILNHEDIFYMEVIESNVWIHTKNKIYRGNKTLQFYEDKLKTQGFFRTHKCYLANLSKAEKFRPRINYTYDMYFKGKKDSIPVSRNKVKLLKSFLE